MPCHLPQDPFMVSCLYIKEYNFKMAEYIHNKDIIKSLPLRHGDTEYKAGRGKGRGKRKNFTFTCAFTLSFFLGASVSLWLIRFLFLNNIRCEKPKSID